jgi:hypothetical protein
MECLKLSLGHLPGTARDVNSRQACRMVIASEGCAVPNTLTENSIFSPYDYSLHAKLIQNAPLCTLSFSECFLVINGEANLFLSKNIFGTLIHIEAAELLLLLIWRQKRNLIRFRFLFLVSSFSSHSMVRCGSFFS